MSYEACNGSISTSDIVKVIFVVYSGGYYLVNAFNCILQYHADFQHILIKFQIEYNVKWIIVYVISSHRSLIVKVHIESSFKIHSLNGMSAFKTCFVSYYIHAF